MNFADYIWQVIIAQAIGTVFAGFGAYLAIRTDLSQINARLKNLEDSAERAHGRIDGLFERHRGAP